MTNKLIEQENKIFLEEKVLDYKTVDLGEDTTISRRTYPIFEKTGTVYDRNELDFIKGASLPNKNNLDMEALGLSSKYKAQLYLLDEKNAYVIYFNPRNKG